MRSETDPTAQTGVRPAIPSPLEAGRAALLRGRWTAAAEAFSLVLCSHTRCRDAAEA